MSGTPIPAAVLARLDRSGNILLSVYRRVLMVAEPTGVFTWDGREVHAGPPEGCSEAFDAILAAYGEVPSAAPLLGREGAMFVECATMPERAHWEDAGLSLYCCWATDAGTAGVYAAGPALPDRVGLPCTLMLVRADYDPVAHARRLLTAGKIAAAYEVLLNTPEHWLASDEARGRLHAERLLALLVIDAKASASERLNRFARALDTFYHATTWHPWLPTAYQSMALFWQRIGRADMGGRILSSCLHVQPDAAMARLRDELGAQAAPETCCPEPPAWSGKSIRVLFITPDRADYGADVLYDGLCRVLGAEKVTEYPWKATLHGGDPALAWGYPCVFNHPGIAQDVQTIAAALREGAFDAVLFADVPKTIPCEILLQLAEAGCGVPWFLLDTSDFCGDYRADLQQHLGGLAFRACFKREMLAGVDYGPTTCPMPFAYPDGHVPGEVLSGSRKGLFWAGKYQFGGRRLTLEYLRAKYGLDFLRHYTQPEYKRELHGALAGLCLFGSGFDTVRFWELPAHGVLLLAEEPPIVLPARFKEGVEALYFRTLPELEERIQEIQDDPERASGIAAAGRTKFLECHTGSARARQLLGWMEQALRTEALN
jgi:tetratricopeptide (TPR) repeat protein